MPYEFKLQRQVEFNETDMAGLVHFANFFRYMESAEHAFFRSLGFSIAMPGTHPPLGWPRVNARCDYLKPLFFEDQFEIHLLVADKRSRSLTYQFRFYKLSQAAPVEVARGGITAVCVAHQAGGGLKAAPIPADIARQIEVAPLALLAPPSSR
jgi:YbgC/YbaW family acyl-CoA thioester hydrolase